MRLHSVPIAALLGALALPAFAQESPEPDDPPRVRREVSVVASRLDDAPPTAVVRVVSREEIDALPGAHTVPDVLRSVLGVDVRRRGPGGVQADVGIRGGDFNGTLVLVDGQPVNDPQSNHLSFDLDVPVAAIERIEVLAGPGSAIWGSNPVGGAVNIVTRGGALGRAAVQLEGRYAHGTQSLDQGGARLAVRVAEPVTVGVDWWRAETSGFREDTEAATEILRLSSRWDTGKGPVTLGLGIAERRFGAYSFYGTAFPNQQESTRTRTATLGGSLDLGGFTLTPSVFVRAHHDDFVLDRGNPAFYENLSDTVTSTARVSVSHAALGGSVAAGVEGGRDTIASSNLGEHARNRGAVFAEFARAWNAEAPGSGGFRVGLRADSYEDYGSRFSPYAGVTVRVAPPLTLRASFGTSFRVPTFTELYYRDPQSAGNPGLEPETAWSIDAGVKLAAGPLGLDAGYFHRDATNLIDFVRTPGDPVFHARNVLSAVTDGIEISAAWERGPAGVPLDTFRPGGLELHGPRRPLRGGRRRRGGPLRPRSRPREDGRVRRPRAPRLARAHRAPHVPLAPELRGRRLAAVLPPLVAGLPGPHPRALRRGREPRERPLRGRAGRSRCPGGRPSRAST